jgi:hypothetical protein
LNMCLQIKRALVFSEKLINPVGYLHRSVDQRKACSWGRRLAWIKPSLAISPLVFLHNPLFLFSFHPLLMPGGFLFV